MTWHIGAYGISLRAFLDNDLAAGPLELHSVQALHALRQQKQRFLSAYTCLHIDSLNLAVAVVVREALDSLECAAAPEHLRQQYQSGLLAAQVFACENGWLLPSQGVVELPLTVTLAEAPMGVRQDDGHMAIITVVFRRTYLTTRLQEPPPFASSCP
jgi:hypothetical protein